MKGKPKAAAKAPARPALDPEKLYLDHLNMRNLLEYLDGKGGLGLDVHDRIRAVLNEVARP